MLLILTTNLQYLLDKLWETLIAKLFRECFTQKNVLQQTCKDRNRTQYVMISRQHEDKTLKSNKICSIMCTYVPSV